MALRPLLSGGIALRSDGNSQRVGADAWLYFTYWTTHSDILKLLIDINRQDIIYACHMKNARELEQAYGALPGMDEVHARYFMAIRTGVTISVLKAWLDGGQKEAAEELVQLIELQLCAFASERFPAAVDTESARW